MIRTAISLKFDPSGEMFPLDLLALHKITVRARGSGMDAEPRLTWMSPDASCGPGSRQSMPA